MDQSTDEITWLFRYDDIMCSKVFTPSIYIQFTWGTCAGLILLSNQIVEDETIVSSKQLFYGVE